MSDTPEQLRTWSARCAQLSRAVATGDRNAFTMRVPAEPDRDADLVLSSVAVALERYAELLEEVEKYPRYTAADWKALADAQALVNEVKLPGGEG